MRNKQDIINEIIDLSLKDKRKKVRNLLGEFAVSVVNENVKPNVFSIDFDDIVASYETNILQVNVGKTFANVQIKGGVNVIIPNTYTNTYTRLYNIAMTDKYYKDGTIKEEDKEAWEAIIERTVFLLCLCPTVTFIDMDFESDIADKYYDFIENKVNDALLADKNVSDEELDKTFNEARQTIADIKKELDAADDNYRKQVIREELETFTSEIENE